MKFYLLMLSIIIPVLGSAQEVTFKYGPPITKETVSNLSYKSWFDTEKGAYAMSRSLMNSPEFFCHLDSYYFILKKGIDEKMALLIFNEQYNLVHAIMVETCESLEKSNFLGIAEFNGSVSLFFEAPSESGNKEKKGVYLSTLNTKTLKLNEPVLVSEFQSSGKIKNFEARVSKNKSYLSLLANPDTKALEYSYSFSVLDKTLIGVITQNDAQNGYYEQATKIINMAKSVSFNAVNAVVGVRISYLFVDNKMEEIRDRISKSMDFILFMTIGCGFGIAGVAKILVPLFFGKGYDQVITLLYIFAPIITIIGISNCLGSQYYTPSGRRNDSTKYLLCGSAVNLILNLCLIGKYGANGAAFASVVAELSITFLYVKNCNGFMKLGNLLRCMYKKIVAGLLMFFVVIGLENYLHVSKLMVLICTGKIIS